MSYTDSSELAASLRRDGFRGEVECERPLGPLTTWRIGGPAELLATPADEEDLCSAASWAAAHGQAVHVMGNGSNLLVSDEGVRGLVIRVRRVLDDVRIEGCVVEAGAGVAFPALARRTARAGLAGLEFAAGIPGTLGGALIMNAGWHEYEIGNHVRHVRVVEANGGIAELTRLDCGFRYRGSRLRDRRTLILGAVLELERGDAAEIESQLDRFAASRKLNQPTEWPSCGSVFLKPPDDFAGRLIEAAELKGTRVGGIEVSKKHANFFINHGSGNCAQVLELVEHVERTVLDRFGVELTREFELWG